MKILGLDVGGANIKAAHSDGAAATFPFALWRQPQCLTPKLRSVADALPPVEEIALTMTAELCDCFATKREGVLRVLDAVEDVAQGRPIHVWQTLTPDGRFTSTEEARENPLACAASNWHALATFVAGMHPHGQTLLIDTGSTTTDVTALRNGRVYTRGLTDTQRLASGELVYLGATRTPLMALGPTIFWQGCEQALMAELFATTADVYVLTGDLPERDDFTDTADGRPLTRTDAATRIVRMIGADTDMIDLGGAVSLARTFANRARWRIADAVKQVVAARQFERVIISGSGAFLAEQSASLSLPQVALNRLSDRIGTEASSAACAHALVQLRLSFKTARVATPQ